MSVDRYTAASLDRYQDRDSDEAAPSLGLLIVVPCLTTGRCLGLLLSDIKRGVLSMAPTAARVLLLEGGADHRVPDREGVTPKRAAEGSPHVRALECAQLLQVGDRG